MKHAKLYICAALFITSCATVDTEKNPEIKDIPQFKEASSTIQNDESRVQILRSTSAKKPNWTSGDYGSLADTYLLPIYIENPIDFYCGCRYSFSPESVPEIPVDLDTCDLGSIESNIRAKRIEWEHVVPRGWVSKAEKCTTVTECKTTNFKSATSDPFVLLPVNGKLNAIRSDNFYGEIAGESRDYGQCDFEVQKVSNITKIEPPDHLKGDVARITLYHAKRYGLVYDVAYLSLLKNWSIIDPIDESERTRIQSIKNLINWNESPLDY